MESSGMRRSHWLIVSVGAEMSFGAENQYCFHHQHAMRALNIDPDYEPDSVNTDGWGPTQTAWRALFSGVSVLVCFLHAWLKIRCRGKKHDLFSEVSRRVWDAYHAVNRRSFSQRIRSLRRFATSHLSGWIQETTLDLCQKRELWSAAYDHPAGHRTSSMLDRLMRGMNRYYDSTQHLHGSAGASRLTSRSQALLWNFTPWHPSQTRRLNWQSPAERLNQHRYHDEWLQNLVISASCGGYRTPPQNP
jgi:hypothetical protein